MRTVAAIALGILLGGIERLTPHVTSVGTAYLPDQAWRRVHDTSALTGLDARGHPLIDRQPQELPPCGPGPARVEAWRFSLSFDTSHL